MTRYLLDTNIVSEIIRNPAGRIAACIARVGEANVCTSIIVAAELRYGAARRASPRLTAQVESVLRVLDIEPFESPADECYALVRTELERAGTPVGAMDMLIAAHAVALHCTVVTDNEGEFSRIRTLRTENWLREAE